MTHRTRTTYLFMVAAALAVFLAFRWCAILGGNTSTVDALITGVFLALLLLPVFREVTLGGVTLKSEIKEIVHREVGKAQLQALQLAAQTDLQMMPLWEQENSSVRTDPDFSAKKVALLESKVAEFERLWAAAGPDDRIHYGLALRDLYWQWLTAARHRWASSPPYHDVWRRVEKGFATLSGRTHTPSR